ncbi:MAG TPA: M48 family metallopeptidase, partial [Kofleriaceae bacterium]
MKVAALVLVASCAQPRSYLGADTPAACTASDAEKCASALAERDLLAGELDIYQDARLRHYVQEIADRLARGSNLKVSPRVVISNHDGTYAPFGNAVVIGRITIQKLGTEAELAAVIAHEMVHVEGHHATVSLFGPEANDKWLTTRRDAEAIADERAVALLERAGYSPSAMPRALLAELETDDEEHPPRADRIARVSALAANRSGFDGREELLQHVDRMVVGRDTRLGVAVGNAWVVASLGIALDFPEDDVARTDGDSLILR